MEGLWLALIIIQYIAKVTTTQDTCPVVRYTGSFKTDDQVSDYALFGHSYENVTTSNVQECFSACVMDCACVSYQLSSTHCELMDEDRHTASSDFKPRAGYKYYELKQKFKPQNTPLACTGRCRNGCCTFTSCLNGGTCVEQCDDVKRKFRCHCRPGFTGKRCENSLSCAAHAKGLVSGLYPITLPSGDKIKVYCDFHSQPGFVWTLIESFAFANNLKYQTKGFTLDFPVNQDSLNWTDYRLSRSAMLHFKSNSTLFRATCKYDTDGLVMRDHIRGLLSNFDITMHRIGTICAHVQYINVRGIKCTECTTHLRQTDSIHIHVNSGHGVNIGCQWDGRNGMVSFTSGMYTYNDLNFGAYGYYNHPVNSAHRCSSSPSSTTQWWLGAPL